MRTRTTTPAVARAVGSPTHDPDGVAPPVTVDVDVADHAAAGHAGADPRDGGVGVRAVGDQGGQGDQARRRRTGAPSGSSRSSLLVMRAGACWCVIADPPWDWSSWDRPGWHCPTVESDASGHPIGSGGFSPHQPHPSHPAPACHHGRMTAELGLGTAALGRPEYLNLGHGGGAWAASHDVDAAAGARRRRCSTSAWAAGVRHLDAARSYGAGEEFLGGWLAAHPGRRERSRVGSKWGYTYVAGLRSAAPRTHETKDHSPADLRPAVARDAGGPRGPARPLPGAQPDPGQPGARRPRPAGGAARPGGHRGPRGALDERPRPGRRGAGGAGAARVAVHHGAVDLEPARALGRGRPRARSTTPAGSSWSRRPWPTAGSHRRRRPRRRPGSRWSPTSWARGWTRSPSPPRWRGPGPTSCSPGASTVAQLDANLAARDLVDEVARVDLGGARRAACRRTGATPLGPAPGPEPAAGPAVSPGLAASASAQTTTAWAPGSGVPLTRSPR